MHCSLDLTTWEKRHLFLAPFNVVHNLQARLGITLSYFVLLKLFSESRCVSDTAAVIRRYSTSGDSTTKQAIYCGFPISTSR